MPKEMQISAGALDQSGGLGGGIASLPQQRAGSSRAAVGANHCQCWLYRSFSTVTLPHFTSHCARAFRPAPLLPLPTQGVLVHVQQLNLVVAAYSQIGDLRRAQLIDVSLIQHALQARMPA